MTHVTSSFQYVSELPFTEFVSLQLFEKLTITPYGPRAFIERKASSRHYDDLG